MFSHSLAHEIETDPKFVGEHFPNSIGQEGIGGNGLGRYCGGGSGGGGYWGGAGNYNAGGGGGGSSFASSIFRRVEMQQGGNSGHGYLIITRLSSCSCQPTIVSKLFSTFIHQYKCRVCQDQLTS